VWRVLAWSRERQRRTLAGRRVLNDRRAPPAERSLSPSHLFMPKRNSEASSSRGARADDEARPEIGESRVSCPACRACLGSCPDGFLRRPPETATPIASLAGPPRSCASTRIRASCRGGMWPQTSTSCATGGERGEARRLDRSGSYGPRVVYPPTPDGDDGHPAADDCAVRVPERAGAPTRWQRPLPSISPATKPGSYTEPSALTRPRGPEDTAGLLFDDQIPRATRSAGAPGRRTCCLSWWRDLTPSLRNVLRRW
jgi:hypothetical protein